MGCIDVQKIDYDAVGDAIRFSGPICEEVKDVAGVRLGAHHAIEIELGEIITLTKECWDSVYLSQLQDATDIARTAEVAFCLMEAKDHAKANISLLTSVRAKRVAAEEQTLPGKKLTDTAKDKAMEKFHVKVFEGLEANLDFSLVKCCVLAGPGKCKIDFFTWMQTYAMKNGKSDFVTKKGIFVCADASNIHNEGMEELLKNDQVQKMVRNTKAAKHFEAIEEMQKRVANDDGRCCYGPREVTFAFENGAVEVLMISDKLFRTSDLKKRREYVDLVQAVRDGGAAAHIFSSDHITGQTLKNFGDIAALTRFETADMFWAHKEINLDTPEKADKQKAKEKRVDPDTGKAMTYDEVVKKYKGVYSEQEIKDYWKWTMVNPRASQSKYDKYDE